VHKTSAVDCKETRCLRYHVKWYTVKNEDTLEAIVLVTIGTQDL